MQCETCRRESPIVLRVVIAKDYNRSLARAMYNCLECYERKERSKSARGFRPPAPATAGAGEPGA